MSKVSVIIPIYNVEQYLPKCLDSVINQTYANLEIICVNDCSIDNSGAILNKYALTDKRIKIINRQQNGGPSFSRQDGLSVAIGEYIYFLDSDDWIDSDFIEKMYVAIIKHRQEAVCCTNILSAFEDGTTKPFLKRDFDEAFVPYSHSCQMAWSWLFKKSFLDKFDLLFPLGLIYEDLYFFNVVIRSLQRIYAINTTTYYHFENKDSIMGAASNRSISNFDIIENLKLIYQYYKDKNKLDEWSIPFFYMPNYMLNIHKNKPEFFTKLKKFYDNIKNDVLNRKNLYSTIELNFFDDIIRAQTYDEYKLLYSNTSIIGALRRKIKETKC